MGLSQIKYSQILKKGKIQPSEKEELQKALDLGGGDKVTWFVEDGYSWPSGSQNIIKSSKSVISKIVNGFDGDEIAVNKSGKIGATYKIGRQKVKFMESGGAAATKAVSDSVMTKIQELGSAKVFEYAIKLNSKKYNTIPVNPNYRIIDNKKCYPDLESINEPVDAVNIFRRSEYVLPIIESAIKVNAKAIWMQDGVINQEAFEAAKNAGLSVVMNDCILRRHMEIDRDLQ